MKVTCLDDMRILFREERMRRGLRKTDFPPLSRKVVDDFESGRAGDVKSETLFALMDGLGWGLAIDTGVEPVAAAAVDPYDDEAQEDIDIGRGFGA